MISCILLTAGESQRFGSPKALAHIHHHKAIEIVQQRLIESLCDEIIVVTGAHEMLIKPYVFKHSKVRLVHNKDYNFGQTSSFQTGVGHVAFDSQGFMLLPIDCPFVSTQTIDELIDCFKKHNPNILTPSYEGKKGHPPIFNAKLKKDILNLSTDKGLNSLVAQHQTQILPMNDPGIIQTFNTQEELEDILKVI